MKIWILSDLHQEIDEHEWVPQINTPEHDVLILAGDINAPAVASIDYAERITEKPIVMVAGNHESYGYVLDDMLREAKLRAALSPNVTFLEDDSVIIDEVRFIGATLWTDFMLFGAGRHTEATYACRSGMNDYKRIKRLGESTGRKRRIQPSDTLKKHKASRQYLEAELERTHVGPTVVVTHHAPMREGISTEWRDDILSNAYASDLSSLIYSAKPNAWIFGHTHIHMDEIVGETRMISNAKGYGDENRSFCAGYVIEL